MIEKIILVMGRIQAKRGLSCWQVQAGGAATGKLCNLYHHLCLETVFQDVKRTQNFYLHYNVNICFLKTCNSIINWLLLSPL